MYGSSELHFQMKNLCKINLLCNLKWHFGIFTPWYRLYVFIFLVFLVWSKTVLTGKYLLKYLQMPVLLFVQGLISRLCVWSGRDPQGHVWLTGLYLVRALHHRECPSYRTPKGHATSMFDLWGNRTIFKKGPRDIWSEMCHNIPTYY